MRNLVRSIVALIALFLTALAQPSSASETKFGPFSFDDAKPDVINLDGEIDVGSALDFRRVLQLAPNAKVMTLNSPGGTVQMALLIADDVHQRNLSTYIGKGNGCYSACAYIFLAGLERQADGELGVHQISSDANDLVSAQMSISDVIDVLNRFDTPVEVMTVMFKTPPKEMHIFTQDEIARYKLNRKNGIPPSVASIQSTPSPAVPPTVGQGADSGVPVQPSAFAPTRTDQASANISAIDEFTKRPTRIVLYTGLDLFGDDISSKHVDDAGECAKSCLSMNGVCKAFTFNTNAKITRGPNCFLKSSAGRADGNSVAISGKFLSGMEPDPQGFSLGTIDPETALFKEVDLPGGDLSTHPYSAAENPSDCRLACIDENRCIAFTYLKRKKECWLKGAVGSPMMRKDMVSGVKKVQSFSPAKIISLN
jgi:hypothetical protein